MKQINIPNITVKNNDTVFVSIVDNEFNKLKIIHEDGTKTEAKRTWIFQAFQSEGDYESGKVFFEKEFTDYAELKSFSAKHSSENKPLYPNYCSTYFDKQP